MSWRPTSRRSVDSAGSGTGETAQKTPSALGSGTPSSARGCLHRGGHRFESPPLHEEVRANRRDFLGAGDKNQVVRKQGRIGRTLYQKIDALYEESGVKSPTDKPLVCLRQ